jgi:hypothetical protein
MIQIVASRSFRLFQGDQKNRESFDLLGSERDSHFVGGEPDPVVGPRKLI